jgi:hypothetical protein
VVVTPSVVAFCKEVTKLWGSSKASDQFGQLDWLLYSAALLQVQVALPLCANGERHSNTYRWI